MLQVEDISVWQLQADVGVSKRLDVVRVSLGRG